jgi:hypothetical protein
MTTFKKLSLPTAPMPYALGVNDATLPLRYEDSQLYGAAVAIGEHTWVTVSDGSATEVIKVGTKDYLGNIPILQRGATPIAFVERACASYGWTDEAIAEMYPESGLEFVDGCGTKTDCACDSMPSELTMGQPVSLVIPYTGSPPSRAVTMAIPGLAYTATASAVSITGMPTTAGTYTVGVKILKGGLSKIANCRVLVVDPTASSSGTGC